MDFVKLIFEGLDKLSNKSYNEQWEIDGEEFIKILPDVKYFDGDDECVMDLYFDERGKRKRPVLIYIHGGGFVAGGKEFRKSIAMWYATQGFFVLNVNYGLSPNAVFPEQLEHLVEALNWIEKNAEKYNLNTKKIVASGDSAGAYFASMLACVCESKSLQKKLNIQTNMHLCAVVLNCGLYDINSVLNKRLAFGMNNKIFESFSGVSKDELNNYEYKDYCSPIALINKRFPPAFLMFSEKDIFCAGQSELLYKKLKEKDIYCERVYSKAPFDNHCFPLEWKNKSAERAREFQFLFLDKIKRGKIKRKLSKAEKIINEEV